MRVEQKEVDIDTSVAGTTLTAALSLEHMYGFSLVIAALAGQNGTLKVQVSNDSQNSINGNGPTPTWVDLATASYAIAGAANQTAYFDAIYYRWMRFSFARTGGAGFLRVLVNSKGN